MTFLNPLDALIPKIPFSFFPDFWVWVTSKARGVRLGRILGVLSIEPFLGEGGVRPEGSIDPPPPGNENPASPTGPQYTIELVPTLRAGGRVYPLLRSVLCACPDRPVPSASAPPLPTPPQGTLYDPGGVRLTLYVDGQQRDSARSWLSIPCHLMSMEVKGQEALQGCVAEMCVWDVALPPGSVQTVYRYGVCNRQGLRL